MNCVLFLTMESHFVDNCLGGQNKTQVVVKSDSKGHMEGNAHNLQGRKDLEESAPSIFPQTHTPRLAAKTKKILSFTLHALPDKESCSCYHTQRSA